MASDWDDRFQELYDGLTELYPHKDPGWRQRKAYKQTVRELGHKPPGLKWALVKLGWGLVRSGGEMDFSWTKNLWKSLRGALGLILAAVLVAIADVVFLEFGTAEKLLALGVPGFLVPIFVAGLVSLRNWLKHKKRLRMP